MSVEKVWITNEGYVVPISKLNDEHLQNTLQHLCNEAKVEAIRSVTRAKEAGNAVPLSFSWKDFLPRIYDHLLEEAERRRRSSVLSDVQDIRLAWLERWNPDDVVATVRRWFRSREADKE